MPAQQDPGHYTAPAVKKARRVTRAAASSTAAAVSVGSSGGSRSQARAAGRRAYTSAPSSSSSPASAATGTSRSSSARSRSASGRSQRAEPSLQKVKPYKAPKLQLAKFHAPKVPKPPKLQTPKAPTVRTPQRLAAHPDRTISGGKVGKNAGQQAQKVRKQSPQQRARNSFKALGIHHEDPKIKGKQEKAVAKRLSKAAKKTQGGLARKLDHAFGPNETITPKQAAVVAESEGLPGKTYAQIAKGESGFRPGVPNPDDGYPSLWQMTPSVQSEATRQKWDKIAAKHPGGPTNPIVAAKQAKVLAGSGTGVSNYFGTGFVTNPDAHLPGGEKAARQKLYGNPKPIPKSVKKQAKHVLGPKTTKKVIQKAKHPTTAPAQKLSGPEDGSRAVVRKLVGSKVHGDHGVKNEGTIHTPGGDHYAPNAYAQDINSPTGNPAEGEPAYNQKSLDKIVANARKFGFEDVPALKIGQNYEGTANGYRLQLLTNEGGTVNHIHVGVRYEGDSATSPAGVSTGGVSTSTSASGASSSAPTASGGTSSKPRKRHKRRRAIKLSKIPAALDPSDYRIKPSEQTYADYVKSLSTKVEV